MKVRSPSDVREAQVQATGTMVSSARDPHSPLPLTVTHGIRSSMLRAPTKVALRHRENSRTYEELVRRIDLVTNAALSEAQLRPGQHALIVANNCIEYVEVVCGLGEAGLTIATITPRVTAGELEAICEDAKAQIVFTDTQTEPIVRAARLRTVDRIVTFGRDYENWLTHGSVPAARANVDETDAWVMGYTSGTTGGPKGVLLSHRSRVLMIYATAVQFGCFSAEDRYLALTPLNHGGALLRLMAALFFGGHAQIMDKFDASGVMRTLSAGQFTSTALVPTHFHAILSLPEEILEECRDLRLRAILSHGAPLPQAMKAQIVSRFGSNVLYETYGSTEAGIVTCIEPRDQLRKDGSVGLPFANTEIRILDEHGRPCAPGEVGELFSRSPYLFNGYWNKPVETRGAFDDGWVTVGDLARRDEEGYLYIVGRKKDMVISGGLNIYPREIEELLLSHPAIADVAVVGVADEKWGQRLRAVVVPSQQQSMNAADIIAFCQGKIASHKIPKDIVFSAALPRNANGKVLKAALQTVCVADGHGR